MSHASGSTNPPGPAAAAPAMDNTYRGPVFRTDQLELGVFLAKGGFGEVHFAKLRTEAGPPKDVVVKQFFPDAGSQAGRAFRSNFEKESAIHMHLESKCPYIAKLIGITEGDCWQVLERVGIDEKYDNTGGPPDFISNLHMLLYYRHADETPYVLSLRSRLQMCLDVALAMLHLTSKGFLHLDLASFNVLVWKDEEGDDVRCKLADFSYTRNKRSISSSLKKGVTAIPTNRTVWMAPELISTMPLKPSERSEIYSFGMIVYVILTGNLPYDGLVDLAIVQLVQDDETRERNLKMPVEADVLPHNAHAAMQQQFQSLVALMRRCLKSQPDERPNFNDIVQQLHLIQGDQPVPNLPLLPSYSQDNPPSSLADIHFLRAICTIGCYGSGNGQCSPPLDGGVTFDPCPYGGVTFDPEGHLVVSDGNNNRLQVFRYCDGMLLRSIGCSGPENGQFSYPWGVAFDAHGHIVVSENSGHRVQVLRYIDGAHILTIGCKGGDDGQFSYANGIAIDSEGNLAVCDCGNHRVQVFRLSDGAHIRTIGGQGSGDGQFRNPCAVAFDSECNLVVADQGNHRIQVLRSNDGAYLRTIGSHGAGIGQFQRPVGIAFDVAGHLVVVEYSGHRVQVLRYIDGAHVRTIGSQGSGNGQFSGPRGGIAIDRDGHIVVADSGNHRLQVFV